MLIKSIEKIMIISPFGTRFRKGTMEKHPGIDVRIFNQDIDPGAQHILPVVAPERLRCITVSTGAWGDFAFFEPLDHPDFLAEIRMWHLTFEVEPGDELEPGDIIGMPQIKGKNTQLHLHFETHDACRNPFDPVKYLKCIGQEYHFYKR